MVGRIDSGHCSGRSASRLKSELQTKLNRAAAAGADDRVGGCYIRRRTRATERPARRVVVGPSVLSAERVGEVGMVKDVKELRAELGTEALAPLEVLGHRQIHVLETCIAEDVPSHGAESAKSRRNQDRLAVRIAAKGRQRIARITHRSSVQSQCFCATSAITWICRITAAREKRDSYRSRFEILRVPEEIPAVRDQLAGSADIGARIHYPKRLCTRQAHDGVDLPAFQELAEAVFPRKQVSHGKGEAMAHVEIAAGILAVGVSAVGPPTPSRTTIPDRTYLLQCVGVSVASDHAEPMVVPRSQSGLQCVVVGAVDVAHLKDLGEIWERTVVGACRLFNTSIGAAGAGAERRYAVGWVSLHARLDRCRRPTSTRCGLVDVANSHQPRSMIADISHF